MYTLPVEDKGCFVFKCTSSGIIALMKDILLRNRYNAHTCTLEVWFLQYHPECCTLQCHPTCQRAAAQTSPCVLCPAWGGLGHCRVISRIVNTGLTAATSFTMSLNSVFSSSFLFGLTSHLVDTAYCLNQWIGHFSFSCVKACLWQTLSWEFWLCHSFILISTFTSWPIMGCVIFPRNCVLY